MAKSTARDKKRLAKLAGTSAVYLYAIASGDRECGSGLAGRIADASRTVRVESGGRLDLLWRGDLSPVCRACPYSPKCGKGL